MTCKASLPIAIAFGLSATGLSNPPELTYSTPMAVVPGETTELVFHGKYLKGATGVWTGFTAETQLVPQATASEVEFPAMRASMQVTESTPCGIYAARVATVGGVSHPLMLMVDNLLSVNEIASNRSLESAQTLLPPIAVDGAGNGTESDFYCLESAQGKWLTLEIVSARLGYTFDAILRVLDEQGRELAVVDDTPGLHGDCRLRFQSMQQQRYYIEVCDSSYSKSDRHRYRLRIDDDPLAEHVSASSERFQQSWSESNLVESESNVSKDGALAIEAPTTVRGVFRAAGEAYYYQLPMTAGSSCKIRGITRSEELPTDLLIQVYSPDGTLKSSHDDAGLDEACFDLQADQAGDFLLCVREVNGRYGAEYSFRVEVTETQASFGLSAKGDRVIIGQGGSGLLPVECKRSGYDGPITLQIDAPSAPYELANNVIEAGQNKTVLKIIPSVDLIPGDSRTIQITGYGKDEGIVEPSPVSFVDEVRLLNPSLAYPPRELWDQLAVSIASPLPDFFGLRLAADQVLFPRIVGELYFTVYCVDRIDGYSAAIQVEAEQLPPGFRTSGNERPVGNSQNNEYRFQINGPADFPLGMHSISVRAIGTFQGQMKEVLITDIPFRVIDPLIVSLNLSSLDAESGEVSILVKAMRFLPRAGGDRKEIVLKWKERPAWLSGPESMSIGIGKNETVVRMSVTPSHEQTERIGPLVLIAETSVNDQTVQVESEPFTIRFPALGDSNKGRVK